MANHNENEERENQRILSRLVEREVIHRATYLVHYFATQPCALEGATDYSWDDDILPLLSRDDWQEPAEDWIANASAAELLDACEALDIDACGFIPADDPDPAATQLAQLRQAVVDHIGEYDDNDRELCEHAGIVDPYTREAFEHWIVSEFLAARLAARGEMTGELFGLTIWGRTCSGQSIACDGVIREIASDIRILVGQRNSWAESDREGGEE